jgi:transposase
VGNERTFVGLDVHAWSVTGHALDADTGEIWQRKLSPDPSDVLAWVLTLPGPVKVGYEAGPTGYGLYRFLNAHGMCCVVGAPSKLHRPHGDRVKTDARDAELLARLLKLEEFVEVSVPSVEQEAARDLVRAREDVRGDLMRARHRLSKMLFAARNPLHRRQAVDRCPRHLVACSEVRPAGPADRLRGGL